MKLIIDDQLVSESAVRRTAARMAAAVKGDTEIDAKIKKIDAKIRELHGKALAVYRKAKAKGAQNVGQTKSHSSASAPGVGVTQAQKKEGKRLQQVTKSGKAALLKRQVGAAMRMKQNASINKAVKALRALKKSLQARAWKQYANRTGKPIVIKHKAIQRPQA